MLIYNTSFLDEYECSSLELDKRRKKETAKYEKIWYDEDIHNLRSVETEFPAIAFNDGVSSEKTLSCEPTVSSLNDEIDFRVSFDDSDDEDYTVMFDKNSFSYKIISTNDLKTDLENDNEKVNLPSLLSPETIVSCFDDLDFFKDFENEFTAIVYNDAQTSKSDLLTESILSPQHIDELDLNDKTSLSEYDKEEQNILYFNDISPFNIIHPDDLKSEKDNDEVNRVHVFNFGGLSDLMAEGLSATMLIEHREIREFREAILDLDTPRALQFQLGGARRRMSWRVFILALGLYTAEEMQTVGFGAYWAESARQIPDKGDLRDYWIGISSAGDFLGIASSQANEKVTVTDLFYLRGMDVDSVNVPYLLARYLRLFAAGRKSGAHISGGQFVARLAEHFGLLTVEILQGLIVIAPTLLVIDMAELVRLQICVEIDGTWAWVALGPERQPDAAAGAPGVAQDDPAVDEGDQAVLAPVQEPQHSMGLFKGAHLRHSRDASGRGLGRPAPLQHSRTSSSQTHDPSILIFLTKPDSELYHLDEQNPKCLEDWENIDFQDLVVDGWVDGNGLNPGGGFRKPGGGLETRGGGDGLEGPGGQLSMI
ncbi:hypothetical protein Tco_1404826 [Tanacetum coccineum]